MLQYNGNDWYVEKFVPTLKEVDGPEKLVLKSDNSINVVQGYNCFPKIEVSVDIKPDVNSVVNPRYEDSSSPPEW